MTQQKWIALKTDPSYCETKAMLQEVPKGPYFLVNQHQMNKFEFCPGIQDLDCQKVENFELRFGYATYSVGDAPGFLPILIGYWFDSSD